MKIMKVIWKLNKPISSSLLMEIFKNEQWKKQTLSTFLSRLSEKGLLNYDKKGNKNIYYAILDENEYKQYEAKNIINTKYNGTIKDFLATFYGGSNINKNELIELKKWLEELSEDD